MELEVKETVHIPVTLPEYLHAYQEEESEAEKIARREKYLSTDIVKVDLLKATATVDIPDSVLEEVERNNKRIEFIKEIREKAKRNPMYENRFPEGNTPVRDIQRLIDDLEEVKNRFVYEGMFRATTEALDMHLRMVFERFLRHDERYTTYI